MSLPNRRPAITQTVEWNNDNYFVTIGFDPDDDHSVAEVWCYGPKIGSERDALLQDICRDISMQIQDGRPIEDIAARANRDYENKPLSLYGVLADELLANV